MKVIASNKKAFHDYFVEETLEAGIVLVGTEVKSVRLGAVNLRDSYAVIKGGEVFLVGAHIAPYEKGNYFNVDPRRTRKLLLQGQSPERAAEKLERFLSAIPLEQSILLLLAPPFMALGEWVSDQRLIDDSHIFARGCRALAKQLGIHFADAGKWDVPLAHDGVHFTEQGHKAFAAGLLEVLK